MCSLCARHYSQPLIILTHLNLTTLGVKYDCYPYFTDEKTEAKGGKSNIPKVTGLVGGEARFEVNALGGIRERPETFIIRVISP